MIIVKNHCKILYKYRERKQVEARKAVNLGSLQVGYWFVHLWVLVVSYISYT